MAELIFIDDIVPVTEYKPKKGPRYSFKRNNPDYTKCSCCKNYVAVIDLRRIGGGKFKTCERCRKYQTAPITIGDMKFKTKKASESYARDTLLALLQNDSEITVKPGDENWNYLRDLFSFKYSDAEILSIRVYYSNGYKAGCEVAVSHINQYGVQDEKVTSWKDCARKKHTVHTHREMLNDAFRNAIHDHLPQIQLGDICNECHSTSRLSIDHVIPFQKIVREFTREHPPPKDMSFGKINGRYCFLNDEYSSKWEEFHNYKAKYQVLCIKCNSRKG